MQKINKNEIKIQKRGKNNYEGLNEKIKKLVKDEKHWTVKVSADEMFKILNAQRNTNTGRHTLASQIQKKLSTPKRSVFCIYSGADKAFYISDEKI